MQYQRTVLLKNNEECLIRNAKGSDAEAVYDNFNLTHSQTDFLLSYPDENRFDIGKEREFLIEKEKSENEIQLCAELHGHIVGTAGIEAVGNMDKTRHRAEFGIGVEEEHWGLGIGRALTMSCIECGACEYICPAKRPLIQAIRKTKAYLRAKVAPNAPAVRTADQKGRSAPAVPPEARVADKESKNG